MQVLTFMVESVECGIDAADVREICLYQEPSAIAGLPGSLCGIINLRGSIIPVLDMRRALQLPETEVTRYTATVILNVGERAIGVVVDSVCEVLAVQPEEIVRPAFFDDETAAYVRGVVSRESRLITVFDLYALVAGCRGTVDGAAMFAELGKERRAVA